MKLQKDFYLRPAFECVKEFLGKKLVFNSPQGRMAGIIFDVEAYPAFADNVHHGNKKTPRTEIMYKEGGYAYIYLIYGVWYQFAIVVNQKNIPDVVFIRGVIPLEGIDLMKKNFGQKPIDFLKLTDSPGKLCKSFGITKGLYGIDLTGDLLWPEDIGIKIKQDQIKQTKRVGINPDYQGAESKLRFWCSPKEFSLIFL